MAAGVDNSPQTPGRWSKNAPLFAVLFVAFVVASVFVRQPPDSDASPATILHYYRTQESSEHIGGPDPSGCRVRPHLVQLPPQLAPAPRR